MTAGLHPDSLVHAQTPLRVDLPSLNHSDETAFTSKGCFVFSTHFQQRLRQHDIDLACVHLQGPAPTREAYLARYGEVDMMLDSFPYPGVTTTCEALWMGVPTLSLAGDTLLSRQGAGMLVPAGLVEWVASSEDEYVEKAIQLGSDWNKLASLRAQLRKQVLSSPVYDAQRFARNFEAALWGMWQAWRDKSLSPAK